MARRIEELPRDWCETKRTACSSRQATLEAVADAISRLVPQTRACATGWLRKRPVPSSRSSRKSCMRSWRRSSPRASTMSRCPASSSWARCIPVSPSAEHWERTVRGTLSAELDWRRLGTSLSNGKTVSQDSRLVLRASVRDQSARTVPCLLLADAATDRARAPLVSSRKPSSRRARRRRLSRSPLGSLHAIEKPR